ncbi:hypothetical protein SEA_ENCELADUS_40 [Mycobacterium phage Enceladus]|uniref:Uncharacterized protein n=6 Tax=Bronvirus TaxID=1623278 RepID=E0YPH4_9CAUD|nr:hypothetical protein LEBRON_41 [Mycobacterium phage LeBron]YP_009635885.1 hypothetical protein FGG55_gp040 [Mycobacterium phage JoeDirt]YP_010105442.1 hypothetical protein KNU85_gp040 [Mycobacterium phage DirkDirk]YP_010114740.1 hypothetical protein KNV76_gp040 [Mycobacterium phage OhShagHennessy]AEK07658.1 hypothetical protein UPIE_41 [Mycobacterium phage UPIE]ASR86023.1 hypothetical protein SEA_APPLETREE2_40 [Mycobacterium phage Appletree2]AYD82220.1 hypothetical protein SEA_WAMBURGRXPRE
MTAAQELPFWLALTEPDYEAIEDLNAALTRLKKDGWTRGKFHDVETGKCCALGAFGYPFPSEESPGVKYLAYAIREREGGHPYPADMPDMSVVIAFNDAYGRTFEDLEAMFRAAIRYAEGEGTHVRPGNQG